MFDFVFMWNCVKLYFGDFDFYFVLKLFLVCKNNELRLLDFILLVINFLLC